MAKLQSHQNFSEVVWAGPVETFCFKAINFGKYFFLKKYRGDKKTATFIKNLNKGCWRKSEVGFFSFEPNFSKIDAKRIGEFPRFDNKQLQSGNPIWQLL